MRKIVCITIFLAFIATSITNSQANLFYHPELISADGLIAKDFWNYSPSVDMSQNNKKLSVIKNKNLISLINVVGGSLPDSTGKGSLIKNYHSSREAKEMLNKIGFFGFRVHKGKVKNDDYLDELAGISFVKKIDDRFYLVEAYMGTPLLWLIDLKSPSEAFLLENPTGMMTNAINEVIVEQVSENSFRFLLNGFPGNGRYSLYPGIKVFDIDFTNLTFSCIDGTYFKDLDHDGKQEVVISREMAYSLYWYWVYKNINGKWVNVSSKYPDFYKNDVVKLLKDSRISKEEENLRKALVRVAESGGVASIQERISE